MMKKYSIVVHPKELLDEIKDMKLHLKSLIGWYSSVNSLAHFTICEFEASDDDFSQVKQKVIELIASRSEQVINLNSFDSFSNGAFFIKPDEESAVYMQELTNYVGEIVKIVIPKVYVSTKPHLSIGRKLNEEQLEIAKNSFMAYSNSFLCNGIMIREFNPIRKQYDLKAFVHF